MQKDSQVPLAAPYPLSRAQALPPTGPPYGPPLRGGLLLGWGEHFGRLICAVDLGPLGLDPMGLGPLGRCGPEAKEQKNGRQWDVEN